VKEKAKGRYLTKVFNYLISGHREVKASLFSEVHIERMKDNEHELQQRNFLSDMWKKLHSDTGQAVE